jgi:hypothetical protein
VERLNVVGVLGDQYLGPRSRPAAARTALVRVGIRTVGDLASASPSNSWRCSSNRVWLQASVTRPNGLPEPMPSQKTRSGSRVSPAAPLRPLPQSASPPNLRLQRRDPDRRAGEVGSGWRLPLAVSGTFSVRLLASPARSRHRVSTPLSRSSRWTRRVIRDCLNVVASRIQVICASR